MKKPVLTALMGIVAVAVLAVSLWRIGATRTDVPVSDITRTEVHESDGSLQKVLEAKQLIVGFDANFPPMCFTDNKGEIVGFDIDMAQEICNRLGVEFVKKPILWDDKEEELDSGKIDYISSMSVTPVSTITMSLSASYIKEDLIFVVGGNSKVKRMYELKGKKVGVQAGSTTQEALEALDIDDDISDVPFDNNIEIMHELRDGKLDAGLVDSLVAYYFISTTDDRYFVLPDSLGEEEFALGFRRNDRDLRDRVQVILNEMKADGTFKKISKKWFGRDITI